MPLFLDIHRNQSDVSPEEVRRAHKCDLEAQEKHGVKYLKYWFDPNRETICCLVEAPNPESCQAVHHEAHGNLADEIIEVESGLVEAFLGGEHTDDLGCVLNGEGALQTSFRTILFSDMVGSTVLNQKLGDRGTMRILRMHDSIIRDCLSNHDGREVKHTGDGILASFVETSKAVSCARSMQRAFETHNASDAENAIQIRIGMSAGEPVSENRDIFGAVVQMASRVCDRAGAGQILVSNVVRELCIGKEFEFDSVGDVDLKGFPEPVRLFEVK